MLLHRELVDISLYFASWQWLLEGIKSFFQNFGDAVDLNNIDQAAFSHCLSQHIVCRLTHILVWFKHLVEASINTLGFEMLYLSSSCIGETKTFIQQRVWTVYKINVKWMHSAHYSAYALKCAKILISSVSQLRVKAFIWQP